MITKPTSKQLKFLDWEFGAFFHFGIRTFNTKHRDWDNIKMEASSFNPSDLDCNQWIETVKNIGCKYAIMTTKHHDGFALWPSKYTDYSVSASPWMNGKGDVVKEFTDACRKGGVAVGLYYSPAQWGNSGKEFSDKDYDDYFIGQITELLSNYGKIDYLWFDGCGSAGHEYDKKRIINTIRTLQPEIMIFAMWDPDVMWVGNEDGYAPLFNPGTQEVDVMGETKVVFMPYECDCRLRGHWFYDDDEYSIKKVDELIGMYELSVGRGANLLLNVGPDQTGKISEPDIMRLNQFKTELDKRYKTSLPFEDIKQTSDNTYTIEYSDYTLNKEFGDTDFIPLTRSVIIEEDITEGIASRKFKLYAHIPSRKPISEKKFCVYYGETIGRKCICRFPAIRAPKFTLEIIESEEQCKIKEMKAYD